MCEDWDPVLQGLQSILRPIDFWNQGSSNEQSDILDWNELLTPRWQFVGLRRTSLGYLAPGTHPVLGSVSDIRGL